MQSKGWSKSGWQDKGWHQKGTEKGAKGKGGKGKGPSTQWDPWWTESRSNMNWIDGPQGEQQWIEEQTWNEASLFSLQCVPCSPVTTKNRWEPLQEETSAWEEEEFPPLEVAGESGGWKVSKKKKGKNIILSKAQAEKRIEDEELLQSLTVEGEQETQTLNAVEHWKGTEGQWTRVKTVVDSGAVDSVAPTTMAPTVEIQSSPGCRRGQYYLSASGDRLANLGQQRLNVTTDEGEGRSVTFQVAEVNRPLTSVAKICDQGNRVVFGAQGGYILNVKTGKMTQFQRESGVYTLNLWLKAGGTSSFGRPGQ